MPLLDERGHFWWHDEPIPAGAIVPQACVPGHLSIAEDGISSLDLDGMLQGGTHPEQLKPIQGILKGDSQHVLLSGVRMVGFGLRAAGISYNQYRADSCLVGHLPFPKGASLSKVMGLGVQLTGFEGWLDLRSINVVSNANSLYVRYKRSKEVKYSIEEGMLSIRYWLNKPFPGKSRQHSLNLHESAVLKYSFSKPHSLDAAKMEYRLLEDLMILLTDSEYSLDWPSVKLKDRKHEYKLYFWRDRNSAAAPGQSECWPTFGQLNNKLGSIFTLLRSKREKFGPGFYLYLGTRRGMQLYTENQFLNLVLGFESYHRTKYGGASPAVKAKIDRILTVVDKKDRRWLKGKLAHADEPNLQERIRHILLSLPLGLDQARCQQFATGCANRRNEISHFGGLRHGSAYEELVRDLAIKSNALFYLYHSLVLQELELGDQIVNGYVYYSPKSFLIKRALVAAKLLEPDEVPPSVGPNSKFDQDDTQS